MMMNKFNHCQNTIIYYIILILTLINIGVAKHGFKCPNNCNNVGECLRNHTCACTLGFTGKTTDSIDQIAFNLNDNCC